jgi:hypothetical protein
VDYIRGTGELPEQDQQLENVPLPEGRYPWLERCPECGTYYEYFHALGYMEDDVTLTRLSDEEARIFLGQEISDRELSNKIKDSLTPALKERGFKPVHRTNPWSWYAWRGECVWLVEVRTVDKHRFYAGYCQQHGFPRQSCLVRSGVFYEFMPTLRAIERARPDLDQKLIKRLKDGRPRPALRDFQVETYLPCPSSPSATRAIWRVEQDGSNLVKVLAQMKGMILADGLAWLEKMSDLSSALQELDQQVDRDRAAGRLERDRLLTANYLAIKLGDQNKVTEYDTLIRQERGQQ